MATSTAHRTKGHRRPSKPHENGGENPLGTDGFEFVEYTANNTKKLAALFEQLGFFPTARHRSKDVTLYQQGDINFIVNHEPDSFARLLRVFMDRRSAPSAFGLKMPLTPWSMR